MRSCVTQVSIISDGTYKEDGGVIFGQMPKSRWDQMTPVDRKNRINLGLNCVLIQNGKECILIDTGIGTKEPEPVKTSYGLGASRLNRELKSRGINPKDVSTVILTSLHFDHSGGSTRIDRSGDAVPTFPYAKYYVQRNAWEEAISPNQRTKHYYHQDDFLPLEERNQLELIDGDQNVVPGISVKVTGGHSSGHQVVLINYGGEKIAYLGDLIPTHMHLDQGLISSVDRFPEETLLEKESLIAKAEKEGWLIVFSHGVDPKSGYIETRKGSTLFRPIQFGLNN
jgi:glyoxylase-like metal-dependent hydrolase (beta-lactamase superfamily II)